MASIRIIRRRIKSVQNISQITRAMEMVAASKMKKAQQAAILGKPYAEKIYQTTRELASRTEQQFHPLLGKGAPQAEKLFVLISTNKGLCGGLNTNLFRYISKLEGAGKNSEFITVGKKGESFIVRNGSHLVADFSDKAPFTDCIPPLAQIIIDGFISGKYNEVHLVFNSFMTALKQIPTDKLLLPISDFEKNEKPEILKFTEFVIEPGIAEVLDSLLPHYIENQLRSAILEAEASEHSARMLAMKNATDAAVDFMEELTLEYNKIRQEKITYEIADMVTARLAVEG